MPRSGLAGPKLVALLAAVTVAVPARSEAQVRKISKDPYVGAIVLDPASGRTLFEDGANVQGYPASVLKLMNLLIILEKLESKALKLSDQVTVTAEAARMGGSQVYLKEKEVFTVEDLLYALMVQSANDVATALAIHIAGSKDAFVELMNRRAQELGMKSTKFCSVHGLPPGKGQQPDVTTPRDLGLLCVELLKHTECLKYTSTRERPFRTDAKEPFIMRTHNNLLGAVEGCDGLKTGYFAAAGYSIAATAKRGDKRVVAVILGSTTKKGRDAKARELIAKGFAEPAAPAAAATK
jgi:D-alanyl-D-alanine carboxypeptidase (penicillin-binding protein 5/6)